MKKYFLTVCVLIFCFGSIFADGDFTSFEPPADDNLLSDIHVEEAPERLPVIKETPKKAEHDSRPFVDYKTVSEDKLTEMEKTVFNFNNKIGKSGEKYPVNGKISEISEVVEKTAEEDFSENTENTEVEVAVADTAASDTDVKAKHVPKGKFLLGAGVGYDFFSGEYETKSGKKFEIKTNFISIRLDAAYNINDKFGVYADFAYGFPGSLDWDEYTLNKKNHLNADYAGVSVDKEKATTGMRSIGVNAGVLYKFGLKSLDLLAGVGFHYDSLARDEEHNDESGIPFKREYTFNNYGLNLHVEGRFDISDSWLVAVRCTPSFIFSGAFDEKRFKNEVKEYSESKTTSKVRFNIGASVGAMYKF